MLWCSSFYEILRQCFHFSARLPETRKILFCLIELLAVSGCIESNALETALTFLVPSGFRQSAPGSHSGNLDQYIVRTSEAPRNKLPLPVVLVSGSTGFTGRADGADKGGESSVANEDGYRFNFGDIDVRLVCKAIFKDMLKENYILDLRVSGKISLASSRPVSRAQLISMLEMAFFALFALNDVIIKEEDVFI